MTIQEETRFIVEGGETFEGRIIPTEHAEIPREVTIKEDATVTEGVYGRSVEINEGARIEGPVMAESDIELHGATVTGGLGTPGRVNAVDSSIGRTVTATKARLEDCTVQGNVVGDEVWVEGGIGLGLAVGTRRLELESTIVYTFKSHGETRLASVAVALPHAVADGEVEIEQPVPVVTLERNGGYVRMDEDDCITHEGTQYLTLVPRILDLDWARDRFQDLEDQLEAYLLRDDRWDLGRDEILNDLGVDADQFLGEAGSVSNDNSQVGQNE